MPRRTFLLLEIQAMKCNQSPHEAPSTPQQAASASQPKEAGGQEIEELLARIGAPRGDSIGQKIQDLLAKNPLPVRRGRPPVMDDEVKSKVCLLLSIGLSRRQAASYLDVVHSTIANAMQRDPEFAAGVQRAEEVGAARPLVAIVTASQKHWRAAAWLLNHNKRRRAHSSEENQETVAEQPGGDAPACPEHNSDAASP